MVQETGIKTIPMEKKRQKATWLSGKALQIAGKRREAKSKGKGAFSLHPGPVDCKACALSCPAVGNLYCP